MMLIAAVIINFLVAAWLYPEVFVHVDLRLVQGHETCGPMQYVFYLISQFYQGGIQLFNRQDLFNTSFTQLSVGLYTPINFIIAFFYVILSPFVTLPAEFFHHFYVILYYGSGLLLRTYGIFLLAHYMTKSKWVALVTSVWVNSFCAIAMIHMGGVCISEVYNYFPLFLFCLVYYWQTRQSNVIIITVLVFVLAINNSLYVGLGYFYQTLHLFLLDMFVIWLIWQRRKKPLLSDRINWTFVMQAIALIGVIFLPVLIWAPNLIHDFQAAASGLGESSGRFNRIFNPVAMMHDPTRYFISSKDVFHNAYDFTFNGWYSVGTFLGTTTLVLSVIGLILSKHSYKIVFVSAAIMMAFLNVPSNQGGWMMWAHWIDTITNPFCFLVRSFHYSVLLWYMSLAIPLCLGIQSCIALVFKHDDQIHGKRIGIIQLLLLVAIVGSFAIHAMPVRLYVLAVLVLFFIFITLFNLKKTDGIPRQWVALIMVLIVGTIEFHSLKTYITTKSVDMNWGYWDGLRIKPRIFSPMYTTPVPTILDYQNPRILPWRFFYRTDDHVVFPLTWEFQGMFGQFYQYTPLVLRLEREQSMYVPRLKVFDHIDKNKNIQQYLRKDGRMMYVADAAIAPNDNDYAKVLAGSLDRRIIEVEEAYLDQRQQLADINLPAPIKDVFKQTFYTFDVNKATSRIRPEGIEYQWALPKNFPRYLSTTLLTPDVWLWQLTIGKEALMPAQGALVHPGTFDVNNVRDGYVTVLVKNDKESIQEQVNLTVLTPSDLIDVWKNTQDEIGITYRFQRNGWWVTHIPYDTKWKLYIDGKHVPIAKVNGYFIGAPVSQGEHQIYLTYWPQSPLRWMIILSTLASLVTMIIVFYMTYRFYRDDGR